MNYALEIIRFLFPLHSVLVEMDVKILRAEKVKSRSAMYERKFQRRCPCSLDNNNEYDSEIQGEFLPCNIFEKDFHRVCVKSGYPRNSRFHVVRLPGVSLH